MPGRSSSASISASSCVAARVVQRLPVERLADELLEMADRIERRADRADERRPLIGRQLVAVLAVEPLPPAPGGSLGVDDQAVEVEEEGADRHADAEYATWRSWASTSAAPSPTRCSSRTDGSRTAKVPTAARQEESVLAGRTRGRRAAGRAVRARDDGRDERAARAARARGRRSSGTPASSISSTCGARRARTSTGCAPSSRSRSCRSSAATACADGWARTASSSRSTSTLPAGRSTRRRSPCACSSRSAIRRTRRAVAAELRRRHPGVHVVASHEVAPEFREYERASTTAADAYLAPVAARYLRALRGAARGRRACRSRS